MVGSGHSGVKTTAGPPGSRRTAPPRVVGQKAPVPLGVPRPVGPSQPVRALHHWVVGQVPLLPVVTSNRFAVWL